MSEQGALWDTEDLNCLTCGRPLDGAVCTWCHPPVHHRTPAAARSIAEKRDKAISDVDRAANTEWKVKAYMKGLSIARSSDTLISEDIWDALTMEGVTTHEPRAMGAVMRRLHSNRVIEPTDRFVTSPSPLGHGRPTRVWRSLVVGGALRTSEPHDRNPDSPARPDPVPPTADSTEFDSDRAEWFSPDKTCFTCGSTDHRTYDCPGCPDCGKYNGRHTDGCTRT